MSALPTVGELLRSTEVWLRGKGVKSPSFDAQYLLGHVLRLDRLQLVLQHERLLTAEEVDAYRALVRRRGQHEPVAYLTGEKGFHALDLEVRPGVLIPRPDTEALVDATLQWLAGPREPVFIADLGCGSGAVGLAIAAAEPAARVYAVDLSEVAVATTKANVAKLGLGDRVAVLRGSWLDPIPAARPIDWVVSNPPYIPTRDLAGLMPDVRDFEPHTALDGGRDGLDAYHQLLPAARARARQGVLVEIGFDQGKEVSALFRKLGFRDVTVWPDVDGRDRVVGGRVPPSA